MQNAIPIDDVIDIATQAGELILENGGETYRAEETTVRVAQALGAKNISAFATPTVVIVSETDSERHSYTAMRRITNRTVNLRKIAQVNSLSRHLANRNKSSNPQQIERLLDRIKNSSGHSHKTIILAAGFSAFFFAMMFGAMLHEAVIAFVIGFLLRIIMIGIERFHVNNFILSVIYGAIISVFCELVFALGFVTNSVVVLTAVLMQVVPGLATVNAIMDLISGDLMSGTARLVDAFMVAAGLSTGAAFGVLVVSHVFS